MSERLVKTVRDSRLASGRLRSEPGSVYEVITRQMVEELGRELRDVRRRIDTLLFVVVSAIVIDIIMRLTGTGG